MKLGIVITDARLAPQALALMRQAAGRGWELRCFLTDSGVRALDEPQLQQLAADGAWVAACELSIERYSVRIPSQVEERVIVGGQYQDAELVHWCDKAAVY